MFRFRFRHMTRKWALLFIAAIISLASASAGFYWHGRGTVHTAVVTPNTPELTAPTKGLALFHLGHSLVGRDMPMMLAQLAHAAGFEGHTYHSQLGWGTPLRAHWYDDVEIGGFDQENAHPHFRPAREAIASGAYDVVILTEMVELRDAIRWHDSATYFFRWALAARQARPDVRLYLYETWHDLNDLDDWLGRLDSDPFELWKTRVLARAWADEGAGAVHLIPAGRVLAAFVRAVNERGGVDGMADETALFARSDDGVLDTIHLNDSGHYLVALTHLAVLYHTPVLGLPHELLRADGTPAAAPSPEAARLMQEVVWDVVRALPVTGIGQGRAE